MYVYEHTNGEYIFKPDIVVKPSPEEYFDSPFVKRWEHFKTKEEAEKWVSEQQSKGEKDRDVFWA